jgi:transposase
MRKKLEDEKIGKTDEVDEIERIKWMSVSESLLDLSNRLNLSPQ